MNNELFMKDFNGEKIFSLEYDKNTLKDMVIDLQDRIFMALDFISEFEYYIPEDEKPELIKILKGDKKTDKEHARKENE